MAVTSPREDRRPLWAQVLGDLERRLTAGEFDRHFPTDQELIDHYGVSRHTVRDAVRRLHERGMIERHRGRGSFVSPRLLSPSMGGIYNLLESLRDAGSTLRADVRSLERVQDDEAAAQLRLPADAPLVRVERVRYVDDVPLARDTAWLPGTVGDLLLDVDFSRLSVWEELNRRSGVPITSTEETVTPLVPDDELRHTLDLGPVEALLRVDRLSLAEGTPVEYRITLLRGERFPYMAAWQAHTGETHAPR
ncbi:MAG: GntR family transcriptional regulator [Nitriliruptoraceae bacterium]